MGQELILYRNLKYQELFDTLRDLLESGSSEIHNTYWCANQLMELAADYGFEGNLWHCFLAFCIANHENAYSTACEIRGRVEGTINQLVLHDDKIFKELFDCNIAELDRNDPEELVPIWENMKHYSSPSDNGRIFNKRIRDRILELARTLEQSENTEQFKAAVEEFYQEFGVGRFGLNKAFRLEEDGNQARIVPITNVEHVYLKDLVGYELQKQKLMENTEAFVRGEAANNVLLYGDAGTGKSSSIKGILNEYYGQGLRMIEVYKHQFKMLSSVLEQVKDRNYRFIIYMDDLSFEDYELEYKYLKAIIEGGLGKKPQNVLIYATSNRRHLIREKFSDKREADDELHTNDTVQEKLSLVARFGESIYFGAPDKKQFQRIVTSLAQKHHITLPLDEVLAEANIWELNHGGLSGRTAAQFVTYLKGKQNRIS